MKKLIFIFLVVFTGCSSMQAQSCSVNDELAGSIRAFWNYVSENENRLFAANPNNMTIYAEIENKAQLINENLHAFLNNEIINGKRELIISCGGNKNYFDLCDKIAAAAPVYAHLIPVSLLPPIERVEEFELYAIRGQTLLPTDIRVHFDDDDGEDLHFLFLLSANHLAILQSDNTGQLYSVYMQGLYNMTFQALGERKSARVKSAEIALLPLIMPSIPLLELKNHIH
jgi:hypothetical protein